MPIYEFFCPARNTIYSFFARSLRYASLTPRCPAGAELPMERMLSTFAVPKGRPEPSADGPSENPADDARMEKVMAEMERDFSGLDSENPDPRQMAQMMRRLAEASGEAMPGEMQEMMRRLEAGEDPEKLDAEYGPAMDQMDDAPAADPAAPKVRRRKLPPQRDPTLYDIAEYID